MDNDQADGLYFTDPAASKGSVLHRDIADVKDGLNRLEKKLDEFEVPTTVSMSVEIEIENGKKISATTTRMLKANETPEEGHEALYKQCLISLSKLIS